MTIKLLTLTLLVTTLTLNASFPKEIRLITKQRSNSISTNIANVLHKRGIDEEKAVELAEDLVGENEELFSLMINNFLNATSIKHDELFDTLSKLALQRKKVDFASYSFLMKLKQNLRNPVINDVMKQKISQIATNNQLLCKVFA